MTRAEAYASLEGIKNPEIATTHIYSISEQVEQDFGDHQIRMVTLQRVPKKSPHIKPKHVRSRRFTTFADSDGFFKREYKITFADGNVRTFSGRTEDLSNIIVRMEHVEGSRFRTLEVIPT